MERVITRAHGNDGLVQKFEKLEFLRLVREKYLEIAKREGFIIVNGTGTPEEVHSRVLEKTKDYWE